MNLKSVIFQLQAIDAACDAHGELDVPVVISTFIPASGASFCHFAAIQYVPGAAGGLGSVIVSPRKPLAPLTPDQVHLIENIWQDIIL